MASSNIVTITEANFKTEVLDSLAPVLVDFWAEWCRPCRMIAPLLDELALEYDGQIKIGKVNVDENQQLATEYRVTAVPTMLFFKYGQVQDVIVGLKSRRDLKASLERVLAS
jgi:thioredoxin 1